MEIRNEDFDGMTVSREKAVNILKNHSMSQNDYNDFFKELGSKAEYKLTDIRAFLGY